MAWPVSTELTIIAYELCDWVHGTGRITVHPSSGNAGEGVPGSTEYHMIGAPRLGEDETGASS